MDESGADDSAARTPEHAAAAPTLGLVVACYSLERVDDILRLISSIQGQSSAPDELVVVVQRSRQLFDLVCEATAKLSESRVLLRFLDRSSGVSRARNAGIRELSTDIIAFVDDDSVLTADWASATREFYAARPDAIGVAGAILPLWDSPAMEWFPREVYWMLSCTYWTATSPTPVRNGYGANMSFRREAFADSRGFSESIGVAGWGASGWRGMGGEEPELALRIVAATGRPIMYVPDIQVWHRVRAHRLTARSLVRRAYWEGRLKAALSRSVHRTADALGTERSLLREMSRVSLARLRLLKAHPVRALRQQVTVVCVVGLVALGFLDGYMRRARIARGNGIDAASGEAQG
jgi:glucosyl-dolichyl phosphate glucuronosyltransferase